jgi:hypothetical protein
MRFHLERKAADLDPLAARRAIRQCRAAPRREPRRLGLGTVRARLAGRPLRFRMLRKNAGVPRLALVTLGIGIGANTLIFTVVHAVLLSPLPYHQPERLVRILGKRTALGQLHVRPDVADIAAQSTAFEDIAVYSPEGADLTEVR